MTFNQFHMTLHVTFNPDTNNEAMIFAILYEIVPVEFLSDRI